MKFYYFNSTHWDREWYQPLQTYRRYLVQTTDGILNALERNPELQQYTFDGQTIVLEDVIEIHPEWRERLTRQIAAGRLNVGPWYVMPDEFLVSGESLVRNLLIGHEVAESFGAPAWPVGYICDIFGHIAQTPQIFKEFGLAPAVLWRGLDAKCAPYFRWQSPDGTECETVKLMSRNGYADFSLWVTGWWDAPLTEAVFKERFQVEVERLRPYFGENMILSDALDHINAHSQAPQLLQWIQELYPDSTVIHTDYREVLDEFSDPSRCPVVAGELIQTVDVKPSDGWMIPHTLSGRYDIKAANDRCQNMLELASDPIQAAATAAGCVEMNPFWKYAWKQLIKNHPHDSICGCSIDAVHRQMLPRFEEIGQVGESLVEGLVLADRFARTGRTIQQDTKTTLVEDHSGTDVAADGNYTLNVYNPLPWERTEVLEFEIAFPAKQEYPERMAEPFGYETLNAFRLFDEAGRELPYQLGRPRLNQVRRFYRHDSRMYHVYPVTAQVALRAAGWNRIAVRPSASNVRFQVSQLEAARSASNGRLTLAINADGTFDLLDRKQNRSYRNLNDFVLDREIGDGWNHVRPAGAATFTGGFGACRVAVKTDGPARTVFEITRSCEVPRELEFRGTVTEGYAGIAESADTVRLTIVSEVTLDRGADFVQVKTSIENTVKDCRLRLVMPTGITGKYFVYQSYAFLEREAGRATGRATETWPESEPLEKNFAGIAGKRDADGGIALMARYGMHELSASDWAGGELFFTLYRAFRRTVATNGETECQLLKPLTFEYRFQLLDATKDDAALYRAMQNYRAELPYYLLPTAAVTTAAADGSWLRLSGGLALGALKPAQTGVAGTVIVRLVNLSDEPRTGVIELERPAALTMVHLNEKPAGAPQSAAKRFTVTAEPWKIVTCKLEF